MMLILDNGEETAFRSGDVLTVKISTGTVQAFRGVDRLKFRWAPGAADDRMILPRLTAENAEAVLEGIVTMVCAMSPDLGLGIFKPEWKGRGDRLVYIF